MYVSSITVIPFFLFYRETFAGEFQMSKTRYGLLCRHAHLPAARYSQSGIDRIVRARNMETYLILFCPLPTECNEFPFLRNPGCR